MSELAPVKPDVYEPAETSAYSSDQSQSAATLFSINDDCLLHVLQFLDVFDLTALKQVSPWRQADLIDYHASREFAFIRLTFNDSGLRLNARATLKFLGPIVKCMEINGLNFNPNPDALDLRYRVLKMVARYCQKLRYLKLLNFKITTKHLPHLEALFETLETFVVVSTEKDYEKIELEFKEPPAKLRCVIFEGPLDLSGIKWHTFPKLEMLTFRKNGPSLSAETIVQSLKVNSTLKRLYLMGLETKDGLAPVVETIAQDLKELKELEMSMFHDETDLAELGNCKKLTRLRLPSPYYRSIDPLLQNLVTHGVQLERLDFYELSSNQMRIETFKLLGRLTHLKHLEIMNYANSIRAEHIQELRALTNLEIISIMGMNDDSQQAIFDIIESNKSLRYLNTTLIEHATERFVDKVFHFLSATSASNRPKLIFAIQESALSKRLVADQKAGKYQDKLKLCLFKFISLNSYLELLGKRT